MTSHIISIFTGANVKFRQGTFHNIVKHTKPKCHVSNLTLSQYA